MFNAPTTKLNIVDLATALNSRNTLQQLKTTGSQPRPSLQAPNPVQSAGRVTTPAHVQNVGVHISKASDATSKITVTFQRDPSDYLFTDTRVYLSGYRGNPAPVQMASGQSPVSFSVDNTGERLTVTVQSSGSLGQAPLSTAPVATCQLIKTNLATVSTPEGNGPPQTPAAPGDTFRNWRGWSAYGRVNDVGLNAYAINPKETGGTTPQAPTATEPASYKSRTAVSANSQCYIEDCGNESTDGQYATLGTMAYQQWRVQLGQTTTMRVWLALWNGVNAESLLMDDTPDKKLVGFFYSDTFGANWQAITQTSAAAQTVTDTGVAAETTLGHVFRIKPSGSSVLFYIDNVLVATNSSNVPATTQVLMGIMSIDNNGNTEQPFIYTCYSQYESRV